jgi:hypothetical protein
MVVCEPGGPWASVARADLSSCLGTKGVVDACVAAVGQPQQVCVWGVSRFRFQHGIAALQTQHASARKFSPPCMPHSMRPLCAHGPFVGIHILGVGTHLACVRIFGRRGGESSCLW